MRIYTLLLFACLFLFDKASENETFCQRDCCADRNACQHRDAACVDAADNADKCDKAYCGKRNLFDDHCRVAGEHGDDGADEGDDLFSDIYVKGLCIGNEYGSVGSLIVSVHVFTFLSMIGM